MREKEGGVDKATKKVMDGVAKFLHSNAPKKKVLVKREHAEYFYGQYHYSTIRLVGPLVRQTGGYLMVYCLEEFQYGEIANSFANF